jgi:hypothetical protein
MKMAPTIGSSFSGMAILEQTPGILRGLLTNAAPADPEWQPSPGRWYQLALFGSEERKRSSICLLGSG